MKVQQGKTYMLRMINAALNYDLFFKIANHNFTVVAVDASYTDHYVTDLIVIAPGQSADVLFTANQPIGSYYMVASPYVVGLDHFDVNVGRGTVIYENAPPSPKPVMPILPPFNDTDTAYNKFYNVITSKVGAHTGFLCLVRLMSTCSLPLGSTQNFVIPRIPTMPRVRAQMVKDFLPA